jgi:hypothetical protein
MEEVDLGDLQILRPFFNLSSHAPHTQLDPQRVTLLAPRGKVTLFVPSSHKELSVFITRVKDMDEHPKG